MTVATLDFYYYSGNGWIPIDPLGDRYLTFSGVAITDYIVGAVSSGNSFIHEPDCRFMFYVHTLNTGGQMVVAFRREDADNHWSLRITSAGVMTLRETVATVGTTRGTSATAVQSGDRIMVTAEDETIEVYINETVVITYASAANFKDETVGQFLSLGTGSVVWNTSAWQYDDDGLYGNIEVGEFQGGMHIWEDVPGIGVHMCEIEGTGHPTNVKYISASSMSLNGAAEAIISDGNLTDGNCIRIELNIYPASTPSGARFFCYDGNDVHIQAPGVTVYAFERGVGVGYWTLINSGQAGVGGDRWANRLDLREKTNSAVSHTWHIALSVSPEYIGNIIPYFGASFYWS